MPKYDVTVTVEAPDLGGAVFKLIYNDSGEPVDSVTKVWAEEVNDD